MEYGLTTNDPDHPSAKLLRLSVNSRGTLPIKVRDEIAAIPGIPKALVPPPVSKQTACKRAVDLMKSKETKTATVAGAHSLYTLNPDKLDRETSDGLGAADTKLTARVMPTETGDGVYIKIDPPNHPAAAYIRDRTDALEQEYSCVYDLKPWLTAKVFPYVGAIRLPDAKGVYMLTKAGNEDGWRLIKAIRDVLKNEVHKSGKVRIYCEGIVPGGSEDAIDLIADAMQDEIERTCRKIEDDLNALDAGKKSMGKRGLSSHLRTAHALRERLVKMQEAYSLADADALSGITEIEKRLGIAELALDS